MGKASSAKKIQRVQRAGVSKHPGQRRPIGFPLAVGAIVVFGILGVFLAREARNTYTGSQPRANIDKWRSAYNVYQCDSFLNPKWKMTAAAAAKGITTNEDGVIHIEPTVKSAAGDNARFKLFAAGVGLKLTKNSYTLPDGTKKTDGDTCKVKNKTSKGEVKLFVWPPQATKNIDPDVIDGPDIASTSFESDGQIYVLAFVPTGTDKIPFPESAVAALKDKFAGGSSNTTTTPGSTTAPASTASPTTTGATTTAGPTTTVKGATTTAAPTTTAKGATTTAKGATTTAAPTTTAATTTTKK